MSTNKTTYFGNGRGAGNATLLEAPYLCTVDTCELTMANFLYIPNLPANVILALIFGLCLIAQLAIGIKKKTWGYMAAMVLGLLLEVIGYAGRITLHMNPFNGDAFLQYLVTLTIGPALLTAAIYLCLGRIINVYGEHLSYFKPRTYTIVFCSFDFICLILQAVGGGIASTSNTNSGTELGRKIMIAGLIFQVTALSVFMIVGIYYCVCVFKGRGTWNREYANLTSSALFKSFLAGLVVSVLAIQIRSIYRCAELWGGFRGELFKNHEATFIVLEGVMIAIASLCLTILHPAICFQGVWHEVNFNFRAKKGASLKSQDEGHTSSGPEMRTGGNTSYVGV